jgi:hypothetical protein
VQGGLYCCHHQIVLLDEDQVQPQDILTYRLKFRFWFQASHIIPPWKNLKEGNTCRLVLKHLNGNS